MLETHTMPAEYQNLVSLVYCNDCEKKSHASYHFLYHKCVNCSGYNTKVIKTFDRSLVNLEDTQ
jgi:RING finger/CHY zinc finger protein 1